MITVSATSDNGGDAYAMWLDNSIFGGVGNDMISIKGLVYKGLEDNVNIIDGGAGDDVLGIDWNNLSSIIDIGGQGGSISGFEHLLLDMTGEEENLDALLDKLGQLTSINADCDADNPLVGRNDLFVKVASDDAGAALIQQVEAMDSYQAASTVNMPSSYIHVEDGDYYILIKAMITDIV
jgi:hypothetical protein